MAEKHSNREEIFLNQLRETSEFIQTLLNESKDLAILHATLRADLEHVNRRLETISKVVSGEGSSSRSLTTRAAIAEQAILNLKDSMATFQIAIKEQLAGLHQPVSADIKSHIDQRLQEMIDTLSEQEKHENKNRSWEHRSFVVGVIGTIILAIIGVLGVVINYLAG